MRTLYIVLRLPTHSEGFSMTKSGQAPAPVVVWTFAGFAALRCTAGAAGAAKAALLTTWRLHVITELG